MATPRQTLAAALTADHPKWAVFDYLHQPENVLLGKPVVCVFRGKVEHGAKPTNLDHKVEVMAFGARTYGDRAENELDDVLDGVLLTIERLKGWTWSEASRDEFFDGTLTGWRITASMTSDNVYRTLIHKERSNAGTDV